MKAGDILLFKGEDGISKLIAWGTGSKYSHVAVSVAPEMNLVIEAITRGGVRARDIRQIKSAYDVYRIKEGQAYDLEKTVSYLVSKLNLKYDYFCSELCYEAFYNGGGLDIVPEVPEADVASPGDIAKSAVVETVFV